MEHTSTAGGTVTVGAFVLDVAAAGGTRIYAAAPSAAADVTSLRHALNGAESTIDEVVERGAAEADEEVDRLPESLEKASTFTDRVEQAVNIATAIAEGRVTDVVEQIDGVLDLADRLHRAGRYEDELRVLRALYRAVVLTLRWVAVIEVLRRAYSAACAYADTHATGWVTHELGTLSVVSGDRERGVRLLEQAQTLRRSADDGQGLDATNHNLAVASRRRIGLLRLVRRPKRAATLLSAATAIVLLAGGASLAVLAERDRAPLAATPTDTTGGASGLGSTAGADRVTSGGSSTQSSGSVGSTTTSEATSTVIQTTSSSTTTGTTTTTTTTTTPVNPVGAATFTGEPADPTKDAAAGFSFVATNATGYRCRLDAGAVTPCDSGTWSPNGALADGRHTFAVWGVAGSRTGSQAPYTWLVDTSPPSVAIDSVSGGVATFTITDSNALANPTCAITDTHAGLAAGTLTSCTLNGAQYTGLTTPGAYTFTLTGSDAAGNSAVAIRHFKG